LEEVGRQGLREILDGGDSMLYDLERDMRAIGMPAIGTTSAGPHRRLQAFMARVREQLPDLDEPAPILGDDPVAAGWVTEAPWTGRIEDYTSDSLIAEDHDYNPMTDIADEG